MPAIVPAGHWGRLPMPTRIGARVKPWKLNLQSSPDAGPRAVGFGVPVSPAASERPGVEAREGCSPPAAVTPAAVAGGGSWNPPWADVDAPADGAPADCAGSR